MFSGWGREVIEGFSGDFQDVFEGFSRAGRGFSDGQRGAFPIGRQHSARHKQPSEKRKIGTKFNIL